MFKKAGRTMTWNILQGPDTIIYLKLSQTEIEWKFKSVAITISDNFNKNTRK